MKRLIVKLVPKTVFGSIYLLISIVILIGIASVYIGEVHAALNMDKSSYECTQDSMMKNICHNPYSSSLYWTALIVGVGAGPLIVVWVIVGLYMITREPKKESEVSDLIKKD